MPTEPHDAHDPETAPADGPRQPGPDRPQWDPVAERDARRQAREARRGPHTTRPEVASRRRRQVPVERVLTSAAIVAIVVAVAVLVDAQSAAGWLVGLVCAIVTLVLVAVLPHATAGRTPDRRRRA